MLKKTITFPDLDGNPVTEDFYFNLNKAECAELELGVSGGLSTHLLEIAKGDDKGTLIRAFKEIIMKTVGKRSEDGRRFIKSDDITNEFMQSEAYSVFFMELVENAGLAAEFMNGVVPSDMRQDVAKVIADSGEDIKKTVDDYTRQELLNMPDAEFINLAGNNSDKWSHKTLTVAFERKNHV